MVIDTSAVIAILLAEPPARKWHGPSKAGAPRLLSAASLLEASVVIETRKGKAGGRELDFLIYRTALEIVAVDSDQAETARTAWRRFGKSHHRAGLNHGDCFAYALAKSRDLPLLFCGDDFAHAISSACRSIERRPRAVATLGASSLPVFLFDHRVGAGEERER